MDETIIKLIAALPLAAVVGGGFQWLQRDRPLKAARTLVDSLGADDGSYNMKALKSQLEELEERRAWRLVAAEKFPARGWGIAVAVVVSAVVGASLMVVFVGPAVLKNPALFVALLATVVTVLVAIVFSPRSMNKQMATLERLKLQVNNGIALSAHTREVVSWPSGTPEEVAKKTAALAEINEATLQAIEARKVDAATEHPIRAYLADTFVSPWKRRRDWLAETAPALFSTKSAPPS